MSFDNRHAHVSDEEDEELMFAFEEQDDALSPRLHSEGSQLFHSIDGVDFERPANPVAATLERQEELNSRKRRYEDAPDLIEEKAAVTPVLSRKHKTFELPNAPARIIRPVAKRLKSNAHERPITAPACLMGNLSLHRTRDQPQVIPQVEIETDHVQFRSASINIPDSFQPIHWPGDAAVSRSGRDRSYSCSSSSSSKSWTSGLGLFCRRSLDVSSPLRMHLNDLVLHSSAGSYTGS
ncbi:hypothetical protein PHMEG_00021121 [Phytophthora megakarya]|uniref:Uncharacterized protein n=1 Tax=Phytophthora megakarya TaxID=4795 RepID=A0A225VMF4_9STRA|nr:hypothetical protein PHMEG_00021121 [Phytophthora megakarya]